MEPRLREAEQSRRTPKFLAMTNQLSNIHRESPTLNLSQTANGPKMNAIPSSSINRKTRSSSVGRDAPLKLSLPSLGPHLRGEEMEDSYDFHRALVS